jgi:hypothetical protein
VFIERQLSGSREGRRRRSPSRGLGRLALLVVVVIVAAAGVVRRFGPGHVHTGSAAAHGATVVRYDLHSRWVHHTLPQTAMVPAGGGAGRPLLVFLQGRGGNRQESNSNGAAC